tara:strand:+ start:2254 stop:2559 length:306 start_codon:yes stop_codon:yes gene_type:complete
MNTINDVKFNIKEKKQLVKDISNLNKIEHIEIFKIFKKDNIKYTENSNGIFINLNKVDDKTLLKVRNFLNFYNNNNKKLNDYTIKRQEIENNYFIDKNDFN